MPEPPCPGLFPLPTLAFPTKPTTRNRKSQRRYAVSSKKISLANGVIQGLNDLHSTSPTDQNVGNPSIPPSLLQQRALRSVQDCCSQYFGCVDPAQSRDVLDEVWAPKAYLQDINDLNAQAYSDITQAVPVAADQVSLPTVTAKVRLLDHLPPDKAYLLQCPRAEMFRPSEEVKSAQVCHMASRTEYIKLLKRMQAVNMLTFTRNPKCVLGFFCVTKPDGSLRLILDCRKLNGIMAPPPKTELPSPEYIAQMEALPGLPVYDAGDDVKDYYHTFWMEEWLHPYFATPPVQAEDLGLQDEYGMGTKVWPCCSTLPMGWHRSVELAQSAHEHIIYSSGEFKRDDALSRDTDRRLDRPRHLVYIDDFHQFGVDKQVLTIKQQKYHSVMVAAHFVVKIEKRIYPTCDGSKVLGMFFHGRQLSLGVHPEKLEVLIALTIRLIRLRKVKGVALARVMGLWTWACLPVRPCFSIFSAVYRFIEVADHRLFDLWPTCEQELMTAVRLAPLMTAKIGTPWFPKVLCQDASKTGNGVVAAPADQEELSRISLAPLPLDEVQEIQQVPVGCVPRTLHPDMQGKTFSVIVAAPWMWEEHINGLEMRSMYTAIRWAASHPNCTQCRLLVWSDSSVVVFSTRKGRSSAPALSRKLRKIAAYCLALGIQLRSVWIPTEFNPADEPSRRYQFCFPLPPRSYPKHVAYKEISLQTGSSANSDGDGPRLTHLEYASVGHRTRAQYQSKVDLYYRWCAKHRRDHHTAEQIDRSMAEYFQYLFDKYEGRRKQWATYTFCGILFFRPDVKGSLGRSNRALCGWEKLVPAKRHPPISWDLCKLFALVLFRMGKPAMARGLLMLFHTYMRGSELVKLKVSHVGDIDDPRLPKKFQKMGIRIRDSKTGVNQWVQVEDKFILSVVRDQVDDAHQCGRNLLFDFSTNKLRRYFKKARCLLGITTPYGLHSHRHGGATHDFMLGKSVERIAIQGRWESSRSTRRYLQQGRSLLLATTLPDHVVQYFPHTQRLLEYCMER